MSTFCVPPTRKKLPCSSARASFDWSLALEHPDLVDEQRAAGRQLDEPRLARDGAAERAALVAEQLDVQHALGEHRAVRLDDRAERGPTGDESPARAASCPCPIRR